MLLDMLVLLDSILQMQLFQINQSEDNSKITIKFNNTCVQLHQRSVTSAFNNNRNYSIPFLVANITLGKYVCLRNLLFIFYLTISKILKI